MAIEIKNTKGLIEPDKLKLKILVYGLPGTGKTSWAATAPEPGFVACETGHGSGLLPVAQAGLDYIEPANIHELEAVASGAAFKEKQTLVVDSLSDMARTFIKDYALSFPRKRGDTDKRRAGVPELDDYGVMAEVTRRLVRKFLDMDKHIIFTATERYDKPGEDEPGGELLIGPDLPGQMFLGSTAMFDFVFRLRTKPVLANPKDAKSRYNQRYFITENAGATIAKCRSSIAQKSLLDANIVVDFNTGEGTFNDILAKVKERYRQFLTPGAPATGPNV